LGSLTNMRGNVESQSAVVMVNPEAMIPSDHPIRVIKKIVDVVLDRIGPQLEAIYAKDGRPSTPPETLLKAQILIALYTVRSERLFCERLRYDFLLLFVPLPLSARSSSGSLLGLGVPWRGGLLFHWSASGLMDVTASQLAEDPTGSELWRQLLLARRSQNRP
jgi:hypothetical protein